LSGIVIYFFYTFLLRYFGHVINDARDFEANIFVFVLFFFQKTLKHKMQYIHDKMV